MSGCAASLMSTDPVKSWTQWLLEWAITVTTAALLLDWAWRSLIRPMVPIIVIFMASGFVVSLIIRRRDRSW